MRLEQDQPAGTVPGADPADRADPACPRAVEPTALLPRRTPGDSLNGRPVRQVQRRAGPEILLRVIDGLNRL